MPCILSPFPFWLIHKHSCISVCILSGASIFSCRRTSILTWIQIIWHADIIHRRRKLFNIGGANPAQPTSIPWRYFQKYIYACVHMHMYAHTCVKYSYTHACMHTHVCMHEHHMQHTLCILICKSLKSKQAISIKKNKYIQVNEESLSYLYCLKSIWICIHLYTCIIKIKATDLHL